MGVDRCAICGFPIPEGTQLCWSCADWRDKAKAKYKENKSMRKWLRKIIRKWIRKECPHICYVCEYKDVCDYCWWLYD